MDPKDIRSWQKYQYETEKRYAERIVASPKGSLERKQVFEEAYSKVISEIIEKYNPGGGETHFPSVVVSIVKKYVRKGGRVFDFGCGGGELISVLAQSGYQSYGIDVAADCVTRAKKKVRGLA